MRTQKNPVDGQQEGRMVWGESTPGEMLRQVEETAPDFEASPVRLLAVEDDELLLNLIGHFFSKKGIRTDLVLNGREALEKLSAQSYDVVFTDLHIPVMDGLSLLEWIKRRHPGTRVVIMSGDNTPENIIMAMRHGATDYILKPFRMPDLLEVVERCSKKIEPANQAALVSLVKQLVQDVRGDLLNLKMMARLLERGHYGSLEASVETQIKELKQKMQSMAAAVEDYCNIATVLSQGRLLSEEQLDLKEDVIMPALNELSLELGRKEINVIDNLDPASLSLERCLIKGNRVLLRGAFRSLCKAAVHQCNEEGNIVFNLSYNGRRFMISICTESPPLPETLRASLADDCFFPDVPAAEQESDDDLGAGLFLARNIVRQHGGELWYEAQENGSKFILTLPANC